MAIRDNGPVPSPRGVTAHACQARVRVGDVARDAAAHQLGEHFAAGRLTLAELHERLGYVLSARTRGQLIQVMADLPAGGPGTDAATGPRASTPHRAGSTAASRPVATAGRPRDCTAPRSHPTGTARLPTAPASGLHAGVPSRSCRSAAARPPASVAGEADGQFDSESAGRFAVIGLLLLAMLVWLLTTLFFTRHGYPPYQHYGSPPWQQ